MILIGQIIGYVMYRAILDSIILVDKNLTQSGQLFIILSKRNLKYKGV